MWRRFTRWRRKPCGTGSISRAAAARCVPAGIAGTGGNASGNSADESWSESRKDQQGQRHPDELEGPDGRRQPSLGGRSQMNREVHVGLGVDIPGATRPQRRPRVRS
jgi:hypothetical protein